MINNSCMGIKEQILIDNEGFREFLNREFDKVAVGATVEDLAEFAFGSLEEAVVAFEKYKAEL